MDLYDPDYVTALGSLLDSCKRILVEAFDSVDEFENAFKVCACARANESWPIVPGPLLPVVAGTPLAYSYISLPESCLSEAWRR